MAGGRIKGNGHKVHDETSCGGRYMEGIDNVALVVRVG